MPAKNLELFPQKGDFRVVSLTGEDVRQRTDDFESFRGLVLESEPMYPGITQWLSKKVFTGLSSPDRIALVAYESGEPAVSAVLKVGGRSKFCHLKVKKVHRDVHLGELFFALMALGCRKAQEIHFTLPESLWEEEKRFFQSFGFTSAMRARQQYRHGEPELACSASAEVVVQNALNKAPKLMRYFTMVGRELRSQLLMSVQPRFARALMDGTKSVEVRRRFSSKWEGARVTVYSSRPDACLLGEVTVSRVVRDAPDRLWKDLGPLMGCSSDEFRAYVGDAGEVSAIVVEEPKPYLSPIPLAQLAHWMSDAPTPPQSFCVIEPEDRWGKALALASFLHGRFASRTSRGVAPMENSGAILEQCGA